MESEPSDVDSNRTREEVSHGVRVGCQATMPEFPESSYPKTSNNSSAVEAARRRHRRANEIARANCARLRALGPIELHLRDGSTWQFLDVIDAMRAMRTEGAGARVTYANGREIARSVRAEASFWFDNPTVARRDRSSIVSGALSPEFEGYTYEWSDTGESVD